jgi:hypothetical protein
MRALAFMLLAAALALPLAACNQAAKTAEPLKYRYVTGKSKTETVKHSVCPDKMALDLSAYYPEGTGSAAVDQFFENYAANFIHKQASEAQADALKNDSACSFDDNLFATADFQPFKSSPGTLAVLYTLSSFLGGAHPSLDYSSFNFDLASGRELAIADLFNDPKAGIGALYSYAYSELCSAKGGREAAQTVLGGTCGKDKKAPKALLALSGPLDSLGHMVLTETGASLNFTPLDLWSWSQGPFKLDIPKEKLLEMGAKDLWGELVQ